MSWFHDASPSRHATFFKPIYMILRKTSRREGRVVSRKLSTVPSKALLPAVHVRTRKKKFSQLALVLLPLTVLVGPRIGIPGFPQGDFRAQDFAVLVSVVVLTVSDLRLRLRRGEAGGRAAAGFWVLLGISILFVMFMVFAQEISLSSFYLLRLLELPIISLLVYRLLCLGGDGALRMLLVAIVFGLLVNSGWVVIQLATDAPGVAWAFTPDVVSSYGPTLLGEAGAFPAGQTTVILLAGVVSFYIARPKSVALGALLGLTMCGLLLGLLLIQSRISFVSGVLVCILLLVAFRRTEIRNVALLTAVGTNFLVLLFLSAFAVGSRFELADLAYSVEVRLSMYLRTLKAVENHFLFGLGPGVGREILGSEYHGLYVAIVSDFGLVGLIVFFLATGFLIAYVFRKSQSSEFFERLFAIWTGLIAMNFLVSGLVQSVHISATPTHFAAIIVGAFFWSTRRRPMSPDGARSERFVAS